MQQWHVFCDVKYAQKNARPFWHKMGVPVAISSSYVRCVLMTVLWNASPFYSKQAYMLMFFYYAKDLACFSWAMPCEGLHFCFWLFTTMQGFLGGPRLACLVRHCCWGRVSWQLNFRDLSEGNRYGGDEIQWHCDGCLEREQKAQNPISIDSRWSTKVCPSCQYCIVFKGQSNFLSGCFCRSLCHVCMCAPLSECHGLAAGLFVLAGASAFVLEENSWMSYQDVVPQTWDFSSISLQLFMVVAPT